MSYADGGDAFDPLEAAAQMVGVQDGILTITGACADIRSSMIVQQGWGEDFANEFSMDLCRALVNQALSPKCSLEEILSEDYG